MKSLILPLGFALALFSSSCGETSEAAESLKEAGSALAEKASGAIGDLKDLDFSSLSADGVKEKAGTLLESAGAMFANIKDKASAEDVVSKLSPLMDKFATVKEAMGDKLNLDSLQGTFEAMKEKIPSGEAIQNALKPLLEKMSALFS